jgi:hypothetical protein
VDQHERHLARLLAHVEHELGDRHADLIVRLADVLVGGPVELELA